MNWKCLLGLHDWWLMGLSPAEVYHHLEQKIPIGPLTERCLHCAKTRSFKERRDTAHAHVRGDGTA